jgi:hypothetical protein
MPDFRAMGQVEAVAIIQTDDDSGSRLKCLDFLLRSSQAAIHPFWLAPFECSILVFRDAKPHMRLIRRLKHGSVRAVDCRFF